MELKEKHSVSFIYLFVIIIKSMNQKQLKII